MNELPAEILHDIFFCLELKERLECLRVCRRWWKALDSYNLFYSFIIRRDEQFNRVMDAFARLPDYAAQVEELSIYEISKSSLDERNLLKTFPNARAILVNRCQYSKVLSSRHLKTHNGVVHSKSKLEYLCDKNYGTLATQMLSLSLGDRLETLELDLVYMEDSLNIFSQLKDLPVLKKLCLSHPHIKIHEIEDIHCNIPSIQDFSLNNGTHLAGSMPSNVLPATCITNFEFTPMKHSDEETCAQLYQYMAKKYTNINKTEYCDDWLTCCDASERRYVYFNGILDFLKRIGRPAQNRLVLHALQDDVNAFEALDAGDSQIEELVLSDCESETVLEYLGMSKQSESIKILDITDTKIKNIQPIKVMSALTSLRIGRQDTHDKRIDLAEWLSDCPTTLKRLVVERAKFFVLPFNQQLESIGYLEIGLVEINTNMGNIISNCLPNLADLKLHGRLECDVHMTFKNPHLQKAEFLFFTKIEEMSTRHGFSFKCPTMTVPQYYEIYLSGVKQAEHEDIKGLPLLSVESLAVKESKGGGGFFIY
jgi:Leucine-rich repeat (LRR) protein